MALLPSGVQALARNGRRVIAPIPSFEEQLRLWGSGAAWAAGAGAGAGAGADSGALSAEHRELLGSLTLPPPPTRRLGPSWV